jgi:hypothetical protein
MLATLEEITESEIDGKDKQLPGSSEFFLAAKFIAFSIILMSPVARILDLFPAALPQEIAEISSTPMTVSQDWRAFAITTLVLLSWIPFFLDSSCSNRRGNL